MQSLQKQRKRPKRNPYPHSLFIDISYHTCQVMHTGDGYTCSYQGWLEDREFPTPGEVVDALFAAYAMTKGTGTADMPLDTASSFPDLLRMEMGPNLIFIYKGHDGRFHYESEGWKAGDRVQSLGLAINAAFERYAESQETKLDGIVLSDISEAIDNH